MTAIGIALIAIGFLISRLFGEDILIYHLTGRTNFWDGVSGICFLIGFGFVTYGVSVFIWNVMP